GLLAEVLTGHVDRRGLLAVAPAPRTAPRLLLHGSGSVVALLDNVLGGLRLLIGHDLFVRLFGHGRRAGALASRRLAGRLLRLRLSGQRLGRRLRLLREHRVGTAVEDALDPNLEALPDEARRLCDDDLEAVGATDRRGAVVAVDFPQLEHQLRAFLEGAGRR